MILNIYIDANSLALDVPAEILEEAEDFFSKMDRDMDRGWQMSRRYVEHPDTTQRCQIAADRILTAVHTGNRKLAMLMAGYILTRMPGIHGVRIDTQGEMFNTTLLMDPD